jgi:hypothetical protein
MSPETDTIEEGFVTEPEGNLEHSGHTEERELERAVESEREEPSLEQERERTEAKTEDTEAALEEQRTQMYGEVSARGEGGIFTGTDILLPDGRSYLQSIIEKSGDAQEIARYREGFEQWRGDGERHIRIPDYTERRADGSEVFHVGHIILGADGRSVTYEIRSTAREAATHDAELPQTAEQNGAHDTSLRHEQRGSHTEERPGEELPELHLVAAQERSAEDEVTNPAERGIETPITIAEQEEAAATPPIAPRGIEETPTTPAVRSYEDTVTRELRGLLEGSLELPQERNESQPQREHAGAERASDPLAEVFDAPTIAPSEETTTETPAASSVAEALLPATEALANEALRSDASPITREIPSVSATQAPRGDGRIEDPMALREDLVRAVPENRAVAPGTRAQERVAPAQPLRDVRTERTENTDAELASTETHAPRGHTDAPRVEHPSREAEIPVSPNTAREQSTVAETLRKVHEALVRQARPEEAVPGSGTHEREKPSGSASEQESRAHHPAEGAPASLRALGVLETPLMRGETLRPQGAPTARRAASDTGDDPARVTRPPSKDGITLVRYRKAA